MGYRYCKTPKGVNINSLLSWGISVCHKNGLKIANHIVCCKRVCKRKDFYAITERKQYNHFEITFSTTAWKHYGVRSMAPWKALILHELCHTIRGCFNHGVKWKAAVRKLNQGGYKINPHPYSNKKNKYYI